MKLWVRFVQIYDIVFMLIKLFIISKSNLRVHCCWKNTNTKPSHNYLLFVKIIIFSRFIVFYQIQYLMSMLCVLDGNDNYWYLIYCYHYSMQTNNNNRFEILIKDSAESSLLEKNETYFAGDIKAKIIFKESHVDLIKESQSRQEIREG